MHVYFVIRVLQGVEWNYSIIEKLVLSKIYTERRLRQYLQAHPILVLTNQQVKQILTQPERSGRMTKYEVKFEEHNIKYKPRVNIKGQALADFLIEMVGDQLQSMWYTEEAPIRLLTLTHNVDEWVMHTDRASSKDSLGDGIILFIQ